MYTYEKLDTADVQTLHRAFSEGFSDYPVDIGLSLEVFQAMLKSRGFVPECSVGAFKEPGHELVGFVLNGVRSWRGKLTAYDLGTAITPPHRKKGLSSGMFKMVLEALAQNNVEQYLLEVLQGNENAFEVYKKLGFSIARTFSAYQLDKDRYISRPSPYDTARAVEIKAAEREQLQLFWDFHPSWQNGMDSICAVQDEYAYVIVRLADTIIGYGIVHKQSGDIPQIAVHKAHRRKGIASGILTALLESTKAESLHILNVDDACETMKSFLLGTGFVRAGGQYEMLLPVSPA